VPDWYRDLLDSVTCTSHRASTCGRKFVQRTVAELPWRQHQIIEELESELAAAPDDVRGAYAKDISGGNPTWSC
jgi:hypothetical protein